MTYSQKDRRAFTIIEAMVVMSLSAVLLGLLLDTFFETNRTTDELVTTQQLRQEAVYISYAVEKMLRYHVDPADLTTSALGLGGAAPPSPAGGDSTSASVSAVLPGSMHANLLTTLPAVLVKITSPTQSAAQPGSAQSAKPALSPAADQTTAIPPSIRPLLTTGTAEAVPTPSEERYQPLLLRLCTLSEGADSTGILHSIRASLEAGAGGSHVVVRRSALGSADKAVGPGRPVSLFRDRIQSDIQFRYAEKYKGLEADWVSATVGKPRLIEYTVRVWPNDAKYTRFEDARDEAGRRLSFTLTSAVRLP